MKKPKQQELTEELSKIDKYGQYTFLCIGTGDWRCSQTGAKVYIQAKYSSIGPGGDFGNDIFFIYKYWSRRVLFHTKNI